MNCTPVCAFRDKSYATEVISSLSKRSCLSAWPNNNLSVSLPVCLTPWSPSMNPSIYSCWYLTQYPTLCSYKGKTVIMSTNKQMQMYDANTPTQITAEIALLFFLLPCWSWSLFLFSCLCFFQPPHCSRCLHPPGTSHNLTMLQYGQALLQHNQPMNTKCL